MTGIVVIDVETTGMSHEEDAVVEIAAVRLSWNGERYDPDGLNHCLVDPERSIPVVASAVHHLTDEDVVDARKLPEAVRHIGVREDDVVIAHNADFDRGFLAPLHGNTWICTWKCAQKLFPDAPAYGNQVLRYFLGIHVHGGNGRSGQPHSAGYDARTTAEIAARMLAKASLEELIQITEDPVLLSKITFGKHRNTPFSDVPKDYLRWLKGQPDLDRNLRHTINHHLG